jgi:hypothetical protein
MHISEVKKHMALEPWALGLAFAANVGVGVALVLLVYQLLEVRIALGVIGGLLVGAGLVWAQATVGAELFTLTFQEKRTIVVVAGLGAALGLVGTMTALRPELE